MFRVVRLHGSPATENPRMTITCPLGERSSACTARNSVGSRADLYILIFWELNLLKIC